MVPTNFEDNIKEKLEARKLEPSNGSWEKLEQELERGNHKPNSNKVWKFGLAAACLIGLLFVSTLVFERNNEIIVTPTIVDTKINEKLKKTENIADTESRKEKSLAAPLKPEITSNPKKIATSATPKPTIEVKNDKINEISNNNTGVAETIIVKKIKEVESSKSEAMINLAIETQSIKEVVAQTQHQKAINNTVTDAEIDALLMGAQKEITHQKKPNDASKTVNADLLLQNIEAELDLSFRNRVLKAVKSGYESVKTAVVERNN